MLGEYKKKNAGHERLLGGADTLANSGRMRGRIKQMRGRKMAVGIARIKMMRPERGVLEKRETEEGDM